MLGPGVLSGLGTHFEYGAGACVMVRAHHICFLLFGLWSVSPQAQPLLRKSDTSRRPCSGDCVSYRPGEKSGLYAENIPVGLKLRSGKINNGDLSKLDLWSFNNADP